MAITLNLWPLLLIVNLCSGFDYAALDKASFSSLDEWFFTLNEQYQILNQFSASFTWNLTIDPTDDLYNEASKFGGIRSKWRNRRCVEAESFKDGMNPTQKRMFWILCRGPKYSDYQGSELSSSLTRIQDIYTMTQVCLPKSFDVCINYNRIWDYTYIMAPNEDFSQLDLSTVKPLDPKDKDHNPLNVFNGQVSDDYYVFRGVNNEVSMDEAEVEFKIRKSQLFCLDIELELEKIMAGNFSALRRPDCGLPTDVVFRWAWEAWRLAVGPNIGRHYQTAVYLMNVGAKNNGYRDIGECWREELETPNLRSHVTNLWNDIKPYYKLLHGVLRNALWKKFDGADLLSRNGPIPAHLLGNMWSQDWSGYFQLLAPFAEINLDEKMKQTNWSTLDMVTRADDFYTSLGINPMTSKFWKHSKFEKTSNKTKCHGSAGNMFKDDDFRMIACVERTVDDFYVIVHEMGHIQYYMHMGHQPPLFQDAANSAFGEAIGDTIFLAMMSPSHLNRLGLIGDKFLVPQNMTPFGAREMRIVHEVQPNRDLLDTPPDIPPKNQPEITLLGKQFPDLDRLNDRMRTYMNFKDKNDRSVNAFDLSFLLRMALNKIPQIPFAFVLDEWRWDLFSGKVSFEDANDHYWRLSVEEQGIHPPDWLNRHNMFDAAAKYHIADNTPYVRYFLASILQTQIFKGLCEKTIFGSVNTGKKLPMPLHRCDIYGSKRAGHLLKKAMSLGSSVHWTEVLFILTGHREIAIKAFIEYYEPLFAWLEKLTIEFDIPIGWDGSK